MPVAIVTGSQTCIPRALADSYEIEILPYGLELKNRSYRDGVDITPEEFYRYLPTVDGLAHTSATPPGVFLEAFERLSARAEGILVITIASGMSTIHHNAIIASTTFTGAPVRVLDSRTAAMAQGFVVIEAAKAAQARASLDECYLVAEEASHKVDLYAYISTFDYLKKSGRVTAVKAFAANALSIKPVFRFKGSEAVLASKKRSTSKARDYIAYQVERHYRRTGLTQISVFHAAAPDEARDLTDMILQRIEIEDDILQTEFTPVMGCHTGPGVVGAAFL